MAVDVGHDVAVHSPHCRGVPLLRAHVAQLVLYSFLLGGVLQVGEDFLGLPGEVHAVYRLGNLEDHERLEVDVVRRIGYEAARPHVVGDGPLRDGVEAVSEHVVGAHVDGACPAHGDGLLERPGVLVVLVVLQHAHPIIPA